LKEKKLQKKAKIYATSAAGSVAVEGAEESATTPGGGIEEPGAEVEEAAEGVIRDTILGAYPSPSQRTSASPKGDERGQSQSFPNPPLRHATEQGQLPLRHPVSLTRVSLQAQDLRGVSKASRSFPRLSTSISSFFFGHSMTKMRVSTWGVS
jgi:hypothetical protein